MQTRYWLIDEKVKEFREEFKITKPRVDMSEVCRLKGWRLIPSELVQGKCEAITLEYKGEYEIHLPKDHRYWCRVKFSLAHECFHVYLGHFKEFNLSPLHSFQIGDKLIDSLDREANIMAAEILMSKEFINDNYHRGSEFLRRSFGVSREAIHNRLDNLGLLAIMEVASSIDDNSKDGPIGSIPRL